MTSGRSDFHRQRRPRLLFAVIGCAAALALVVGVRGSLSAPTTTTVALTANGTVEAKQLTLDFSAPGRLVAVDVRAGQQVAAGQLLARLDPTAATAAVATAEANLATARAQLRQLYRGLSAVERLQLQVALRQAQLAETNAKQSLLDSRAAGSADATRLQAAIDQAQSRLAADQAKLATDQKKTADDETTCDADQAAVSAATNQVAVDRARLGTDSARLLADQKTQADDQAANPADPAKVATDAKAILDDEAALSADQSKLADDIAAFGDARSALSADRAALGSDQQTVAADGDRINGDQNAVTDASNAQAGGVVSERQTVHGAQSALATARLSTAATQAANAVRGQRSPVATVVSARAAVTVASANLSLARQSLNQTRLLAPFAGTVASVDAVVGQLVGANPSGLITIVDLRHLTVAANFSGADTVLLAPGDTATVTIAALAGQQLSGRVSAVDPLPVVTSNSGAPSATSAATSAAQTAATSATPPATSYQATIALSAPPATLRPGMDVTTAVAATVPLTTGRR